MTNGFVVSERLGLQSFAETYYRIFNDDLPVFVTADSVLHAWHRTYITMLEEMEELQLSRFLESTLDAMASQIPALWSDYQRAAALADPGLYLQNSFSDADYFLTVARG